MFKRFVCLISLFLILSLINITQAELVAHYPLDEGTGDTAIDISGNGHDGTSSGLEWIDGPEGFGKAVYFDGGNPAANYLNCGTWDPSQGTGQLTVALWVRWDGPVSGVYQGIVAKRNGWGAGQVRWHLEVNANSPYDLGISNFNDSIGASPITQDEWTHVALTFDGTTATIYVNGEVAGQGGWSLGTPTTAQIEIGADNPGGWNAWNGGIDDVRFYDNALTQGEIKGLMSTSNSSSYNPFPEDLSDDISRDVIMSWSPGEFADTHNVFIGTDFNDVNDSSAANLLGDTIVAEGLDVNNYTPDALEFSQTYFWRVDEVNVPSDPGEYKGNIWSFTVEPFAYKILSENITPTAISSDAGSDPNNTINESGLSGVDLNKHTKNSEQAWISDFLQAGEDAWIQYDFDKVYKLHQMLVWNYNVAFFWITGFKDVTVEYSEDGENWQTLGDVQFASAPGTDDYEYNTVVDFGGMAVKSVRLTAHSNYHTTYLKYGLSEVRFLYIPVRAREPKPEDGSVDVSPDVTVSWRAGREAVEHDVYISTDQQSVIDGTASKATVAQSQDGPLSLNLGNIYYWRVDEVNNSATPSVWMSDIWNFSTKEFISIEDFEDYNDSTGYELWSTWIDGYGINDNGSQMGHNTIPFAEEDIVQNGSQSAPLYYDNTTTANKSEVVRTYDTLQNLSAFGADTLRLYYRGNAVQFEETSPGTIIMSGAGADIYGTSDAFRFVYMTLTGNGSIIARVDSLETVGTYSKAGVMIRETLDVSSKLADSIRQANNSLAFQRRTEAGVAITQTESANSGTMPIWLKIIRSGNTFTSERSYDGVTWEPINGGTTATSISLTMSNTVYIGLAVCSNSAGELAAASFSNVQVTGNVSGTWQVADIGDPDQGATNTLDELYVALEDSTGARSASAFAPATALGVGSWTEWNVSLSEFTGVNLTRIKKIIIGVGNTTAPKKGQGLVYIDNISYGHALEQ